MAPSELISPIEAAALLSVDPKTVSRWATTGKIDSVRTPGGHRRFVRAEILAIAVNGGRAGQPTANPFRITVPRPSAEYEPRRDDVSGVGRSAAIAATAVALAADLMAEQTQADVAREASAVDQAAQLTAAAAARLRDARLKSAEQAAQAVAEDAARMAAQVKVRTDASASRLSEAAADAAALVMSAQQSGRDPKDAARAAQLASTVRDAAVAAAQDSVEAAALVARSVAAAAALVAAQVAAADIAIESEVAQLAAAVQALATANARTAAAEADARASAVAEVARDAARGLRRRAIERQRPGGEAAIAPEPLPSHDFDSGRRPPAYASVPQRR